MLPRLGELGGYRGVAPPIADVLEHPDDPLCLP